MPYIKVDFQRLAQLETQLAQLPSIIDSAASTAASVRSGLDWDVACENAIDSRLRSISESLENCADRMKKTAAFVAETATLYRETENLCAQDEAAVKAALRAEGEALLRQAQEMKIQNAVNNAISTDDPIANYLAGIRDENESLLIQAAAYGYNFASFEWVDFVKKMVPGSEAVDEARKIAIQKAYASMIQTNEPMYADLDGFDNAATLILDGGEQIITNVAGKGDSAFAAIGFVKDTAVDLVHYQQWNTSQKELFAATLSSSAENLQLLKEIKTAFPEDNILVEYCEDTIKEIEYFVKSDDLTKMVDAYWNNKASEGTEMAIGKNAIESGLNYAVPKVVEMGIDKVLGAGGGVVTAVGSGTGYAAELVFGTGTTAETYENVDIMYSNIESSINAYDQAVRSGRISASAQRFQELNILNQKMAALDMTTSLNQSFGVKNAELVDGVDSMKNSLQRSYETLAP